VCVNFLGFQHERFNIFELFPTLIAGLGGDFRAKKIQKTDESDIGVEKRNTAGMAREIPSRQLRGGDGSSVGEIDYRYFSGVKGFHHLPKHGDAPSHADRYQAKK
jgi:hypothetical protein